MDNNDFTYNYSAKEQQELKVIRSKYVAPAEDSMARLRRLDSGVTKKAQSVALTLGIIGTLILGLGMSLIMTDLAATLGLGTTAALIAGVAIGVAGGVLVSLAYPIYNAVLRRERARIAPEIIRLTDELIK